VRYGHCGSLGVIGLKIYVHFFMVRRVIHASSIFVSLISRSLTPCVASYDMLHSYCEESLLLPLTSKREWRPIFGVRDYFVYLRLSS